MKKILFVLSIVILSIGTITCKKQEEKTPAQEKTKISFQGKNSIPVEIVETAANDLVGNRLVYAIKEKIRKSDNMKLSYGGEERFKMFINTMPMWRYPNAATIYGVVWTIADEKDAVNYYVNSTLGYCGLTVVEQAADGVVAETDKLISDIIKSWMMYQK